MKNIEYYKQELTKQKRIKWISIPIAIAIIITTFFTTMIINYQLKEFATFLVIIEIGIEAGIYVNQNKKILKINNHINELKVITESIEDSK